MLRRFGFIMVALFALTPDAQGGPLESLSQGAQWIWTLGMGCKPFDASAASAKLADYACPGAEAGTGIERQGRDLAKLGLKLEDSAENRLIAKLATQQATDDLCARDYATAMANGNPAMKQLMRRAQALRQARFTMDASLLALQQKAGIRSGE